MNHPLNPTYTLPCCRLRGGENKRQNSRRWEGRAGPTHLTCGVRERNIYIQTQITAGLSLPDPLLISFSTSFHPLCSSTLASFSHTNVPSCLFTCFFLALPSLSPPPRPPRPPLQAHECGDGVISSFHLFKLQQNISLKRSGVRAVENR